MSKWIAVGLVIGLLLVVGCFTATLIVGERDIEVLECTYSCDRQYTPDTAEWTECCTECGSR
jgi:hypothetical protein